MTNRGWSSLGNRSYGLQRVRLEGEAPFAIREMRALHDGFELTFTEAPAPGSLTPDALAMTSFTYHYSSAYGGDEIDTRELTITPSAATGDGHTVRLHVPGLREHYVHELHLTGVTSASGRPLETTSAYYTLNKIPPAGKAPDPR